MTCKHFIRDDLTDKYAFGECQKVIDFQAKGATPAMIERVIHEKLNGGLNSGNNKYFFEVACCNAERGCEKFQSKETGY